MKRKLVTLMCGLLLIANTTPVFAQEYTEPTDSAKVPVEFSKESYFTVTLPETIIASKGVKSVDFNYSVEGDISADKKVTVDLEDSNLALNGYQLELSDVLGNSKDATISIPKTDFNSTEITSKVTETGNVSFSGLTAGHWSGIAKFNINLETVGGTSEDPEVLAAGLYDADGNMTKSWDELVSDGIVDVVDGKLSVDTRDLQDPFGFVIKDGVTSIQDDTFMQSELVSITIPDSVTTIGKQAFNDSNLTSVVIPKNVTSIGWHAFSDTPELSSIVVSSENTTFDSRNDCNAIIDTTSNTLISGCKNTVIPDTVVTIGEDAFYQCSSLTSITIPESVTTIDKNAFAYCTGLTDVSIPSSVIAVNANTATDSPFLGCNGQTTTSILKKDSTKLWLIVETSDGVLPSGFGAYWNYYDSTKANGYQVMTFINN